MPEPSLFRHYQIVQDADGNNLELARDADQVAVLAFDTRLLEYVHCHVLLEPLPDRPAFEENCRKIQSAGHPLLSRLADFGEDDGNPFYITGNVDGETLRAYLTRQTELPGWLGVTIASRALEAVIALCERGDLLPDAALESLRIVQTGPQTVLVFTADYRLLARPAARGRGLKSTFDKQSKFLLAFLKEQAGGGPTLPETPVPAADFTELLGSCLSSACPDTLPALRDLRQGLLKLVPDHLGGEIPTAHKPRALLAPHLASYQEVARGVVNLVRIQSQRLDMASPYSMRGTLTKTGRPVLVEQVPPHTLSAPAVAAAVEKVHKLDKKRDYPGLIQVALLHESDGLTCLAEELVEGITLADLLRERRALNVNETYLVLAGLDAALTHLDAAALETRRLRLEDIFLLTGFPREDPRSTKLLLTKLNEWPNFSVMLRVHPTLASMSGRGTNPGLLLPAAEPPAAAGSGAGTGAGTRKKSPPAPSPSPWNAAWLAAVGRFLLALEPLPGAQQENTPPGGRERETVARLLDDELAKGRDGSPGKRGDFLARYARVVQHHDLVKPVAAPPSEPLEEPPPARPPAARRPLQVIGREPPQPQPQPQQPGALRPEPAPAALTSGIPAAAAAARPTIGFAELLFRDSTSPLPMPEHDWNKSAADAPPTIHPAEALLPPRDYVPLWLRAFVFIGGSMVAGGLIAHFTGGALWLKNKPARSKAVIEVMRPGSSAPASAPAPTASPAPAPSPRPPAAAGVPKAIPVVPIPSPAVPPLSPGAAGQPAMAPPPVPAAPAPPPGSFGLKPPASLREQIVDLPPAGR